MLLELKRMVTVVFRRSLCLSSIQIWPNSMSLHLFILLFFTEYIKPNIHYTLSIYFFLSDRFFWFIIGSTATVMLCPGYRTFLPTGKLHRTSAQATCSMFHLPRVWWQAMKQAKWDECMCLALMLLCVQESSGWWGIHLGRKGRMIYLFIFFKLDIKVLLYIKILLALITHYLRAVIHRVGLGYMTAHTPIKVTAVDWNSSKRWREHKKSSGAAPVPTNDGSLACFLFFCFFCKLCTWTINWVL